MSTWLSRSPSQHTFSVEMSWMEMLKCWCFARTWGWTMFTMLSMTSRRET